MTMVEAPDQPADTPTAASWVLFRCHFLAFGTYLYTFFLGFFNNFMMKHGWRSGKYLLLDGNTNSTSGFLSFTGFKWVFNILNIPQDNYMGSSSS